MVNMRYPIIHVRLTPLGVIELYVNMCLSLIPKASYLLHTSSSSFHIRETSIRDGQVWSAKAFMTLIWSDYLFSILSREVSCHFTVNSNETMPKVLHLKGIEHERLAPSAHPGESHRKRVINVRFARKHFFIGLLSCMRPLLHFRLNTP